MAEITRRRAEEFLRELFNFLFDVPDGLCRARCVGQCRPALGLHGAALAACQREGQASCDGDEKDTRNGSQCDSFDD